MKTMFLGIIAQIIIFIISLILGDHEIIKKGNFILIMLTCFFAYGNAQGAGGWEFVGLKEEDKNRVLDHRGKIGLKYLFFIIPSLIVMAITLILVQ